MNRNPNQKPVGFGTALREALTLNGDFYEHTPNTPQTQRQAQMIVGLAALSRAIGSSVILLINRASVPLLLLGLLLNLLSVWGGYYFWTFSIQQSGRWLTQRVPAYRDLLIPIGFAYAPQALNFLTLIPLLGRPIELILALWSLLAITVAVRQGLDISTRRSAAICVVGWTLVQVAVGATQIFEQAIAPD